LETATVWIVVAGERWRATAVAQQRNLAARWGGDARILCVEQTAAVDAPPSPELEPMWREWSSLLDELALTNRYNHPLRALRRFRQYDPSRASTAPFAMLGCLQGARLLMVGSIGARRVTEGLGPLARVGPSLHVLEVPETSTVARAGEDPAHFSRLAQAMMGSLLSAGSFDSLRLLNLGAESEIARHVQSSERVDSWSYAIPKIRWWAQLIDPGTRRPIAKASRNANRQDNKLWKAFDGAATFEVVTRADQVDAFISAAVSIVRQSYQAAIGVGVRDDPAFRALLLEMADAGTLRGYLIRGKGEPLSYVLGDRWGNTFSLWALTFLPQYGHLSPGTVAMRRAMRALAEEGVEQLDFGWGDAEYKRRFGDRRVDEVDAVLFARRTLPSVAFAVARARTSVKAAADEASARLGLRTRLRDLKRRLRGGASEPT
jgi:hypothetical protein